MSTRPSEAAWNNPVLYTLRPDGTVLPGRIANRYDALSLHTRMQETLLLLDREVPSFFKLFYGDLLIDAGRIEVVTYDTPCFWSGETSLAQAPGVIETMAGWADGEEVVRVQFDPQTVTREALDRFAANEGFRANTSSGFRIDKEPQFYLRKHLARHLPLSAAQRTKLNVAVPYGQLPDSLLSPQQIAWLRSADLPRLSDSETYRRNIRESWPDLARQSPRIGLSDLEANP